MFKRFRVLVLALALVMSALMCNPANAQGVLVDSTLANGFYNEQEVFDAWGTFTKNEQNDYAGMYIDEKDNLILLFVNDSTSSKSALSKAKEQNGMLVSKDGMRKQNMSIETRKYSYGTLEKVMDLLTDKAYANKDIKTIAIDVKNNKINVGITASATKNNVESFLSGLLDTITDVKVDIDIITTHIEEEEFDMLTTINGNSRINNGSMAASVGVGYYRYSTGERGFITCGHGFSTSDVIRNDNGTRIGVITKKVLNGKCDASFVRFDDEDSFVSNAYVHEELTWDVPIVGTTVTQRGAYSGTVSGEVVNNNFSYISEDYNWKNLIRTNGVMQHGDSGGGMKCGLMDGGRTAKIVGIVHAGNSSATLFIKGEVISKALNQ